MILNMLLLVGEFKYMNLEECFAELAWIKKGD